MNHNFVESERTTAGHDRVVKIVAGHNHAASAAQPDALNILGNIRQGVATTQELPQQIIAAEVQGVHSNILAKLPVKETMKGTIRNQRNNNGQLPLPRNLEELQIPDVIFYYIEILFCKNLPWL